MRCPHCKTENRDGSLLCEKCGRSLTSDGSGAALGAGAGHSSIAVSPTPENAPAASSLAPSSLAAPASGIPSAAQPALVGGRASVAPRAQSTSPLAWPLLFITAVISGVLVGAGYYLLQQGFDLIVIFPLLAGFIAGGLLGVPIHLAKIRSGKVSALNGLICGLVVVLTMQVMGAMELFGPSKLPSLQSLLIYEQLRGAVGSTITHNSAQVHTSGLGFWALEGFEMLLIMGASAGTALGIASRTFCEGCNAWYVNTHVMSVHPIQNVLLWPQIHAQNWAALRAISKGKRTDSKNVTSLTVNRCPKCNEGALVVTSTGGSVPTEFARRPLSREAVSELLQKPKRK